MNRRKALNEWDAWRGGEAADIERARPVLKTMGEEIVHCGPVGAGPRMKIVNNYMSIVSTR